MECERTAFWCLYEYEYETDSVYVYDLGFDTETGFEKVQEKGCREKPLGKTLTITCCLLSLKISLLFLSIVVDILP